METIQTSMILPDGHLGIPATHSAATTSCGASHSSGGTAVILEQRRDGHNDTVGTKDLMGEDGIRECDQLAIVYTDGKH